MADLAEHFDFIVVGSGGGSMVAALAMRAAGKSVAILEKTNLVGGTTARSGGVMWIPNNRFMKRDGVHDSTEDAIAYLDALASESRAAPGSTRERRRRYVIEAPRMIDFLVEQGIRLTRVSYWPDYYDEKPGGSAFGRTVVAEMFNARELGEWYTRLRPGHFGLPVTCEELLQLPHIKYSLKSKIIAFRAGVRMMISKLTGKHLVSGGMSLQGRMLKAALRAGAEIRVSTQVTELLVEDGAVKGVIAMVNDRPVGIGARLGVLVNAGGFSRNQAMREKYQPGTSADWTMAGPGDTGEMIVEMMRQGAWTAQMEEMVGHQITLPPGAAKADFKPSAQRLTAMPHAILVDQRGSRYMNEAGSYMAYCKGMLERNRTVPAVPSWAIFDTQCMARYMIAGTMPGTAKPKKWYETAYLRKGETLQELAITLKISPEILAETVGRFNGFARKGFDEDFMRGSRAYDCWLGDHTKPHASLGAVERGPFYAVPVLPGDVGTYGGVVCDVDGRVLRLDGSPIQGLYATGVSTASVMGRTYPGAGGSVGPSFVWGYVAANDALLRERDALAQAGTNV